MNSLISSLFRRFPWLRERFDVSPLDSVDALGAFVRTRASYVAQTALYGYLKTRMGTKFRILFEDPVFSRSIRISAGKVFASCLGDLTIFAVANVVRSTDLAPEKAVGLARHLFRSGLAEGLAALAPDERPDGPEAAFDDRLEGVSWPGLADGRAAFGGSEGDLIRFAPVSDEFKALDDQIVSNSIRFRWTDVREQLQKRLDAAAVAADWRSR